MSKDFLKPNNRAVADIYSIMTGYSALRYDCLAKIGRTKADGKFSDSYKESEEKRLRGVHANARKKALAKLEAKRKEIIEELTLSDIKSGKVDRDLRDVLESVKLSPSELTMLARNHSANALDLRMIEAAALKNGYRLHGFNPVEDRIEKIEQLINLTEKLIEKDAFSLSDNGFDFDRTGIEIAFEQTDALVDSVNMENLRVVPNTPEGDVVADIQDRRAENAKTAASEEKKFLEGFNDPIDETGGKPISGDSPEPEHEEIKKVRMDMGYLDIDKSIIEDSAIALGIETDFSQLLDGTLSPGDLKKTADAERERGHIETADALLRLANARQTLNVEYRPEKADSANAWSAVTAKTTNDRALLRTRQREAAKAAEIASKEE